MRGELPPFLKTALGDKVMPPPIWIMRQAGRYLPEYREIRQKYPFWTLCSNPELAAEVTLQPLRRFPLDAAIIFSDIMTPLVEMGVGLSFRPGPVLESPITTIEQVNSLRIPEPDELAPFVGKAISIVKAERPDIPVIGFAGAPFTLAAYLVEGGGSKDFRKFRTFLYSSPQTARVLLDKLTEVTILYLENQIAAGADAIQIFDSWAGLASERIFLEYSFPYLQKIFQTIGKRRSNRGIAVPKIYFAVGVRHLWHQIANLAVDVIGIDWQNSLERAVLFFDGRTIQGNLDPAVLFAEKSVIAQKIEEIVKSAEKTPHIFNLGHGIYPDTPLESVEFLVHKIKELEV